jgi:hypothetical protein
MTIREAFAAQILAGMAARDIGLYVDAPSEAVEWADDLLLAFKELA